MIYGVDLNFGTEIFQLLFQILPQPTNCKAPSCSRKSCKNDVKHILRLASHNGTMRVLLFIILYLTFLLARRHWTLRNGLVLNSIRPHVSALNQTYVIVMKKGVISCCHFYCWSVLYVDRDKEFDNYSKTIFYTFYMRTNTAFFYYDEINRDCITYLLNKIC